MAHPADARAEAIDLQDVRFQRQVVRLHKLGPRAVAEALAEIGRRATVRNVVDVVVDEFAALDYNAIRAAGGDRFAPCPLMLAPKS